MTYISSTVTVCRPRTSLFDRLMDSYGVWRQRQALKNLDKSALADIGLTRHQALREANRAFWDLPTR